MDVAGIGGVGLWCRGKCGGGFSLIFEKIGDFLGSSGWCFTMSQGVIRRHKTS